MTYRVDGFKGHADAIPLRTVALAIERNASAIVGLDEAARVE
jgi:hypothetical protein